MRKRNEEILIFLALLKLIRYRYQYLEEKNEKEFGISIENKKINLKACDFHFVVVVVNFNLYAL